MNEPRWGKEHKYSPTAFLFVGEAIFLQLELGEDESGKPAVGRRIFTYAIEGDQIWVSQPREGDPQTSSGRWRFDHESNLWLEIGCEWVPLFRQLSRHLLVGDSLMPISSTRLS
jgi:hypothetical protein